MIAWRAYFTDGRRFDSRADDPASLPSDGCLGIVKYLDKPYRQILSGDDHYFFWKGEWFSNSDAREEIERRYPGCLIIRGKWAASEEMSRVQAEMAAAKEAP